MRGRRCRARVARRGRAEQPEWVVARRWCRRRRQRAELARPERAAPRPAKRRESGLVEVLRRRPLEPAADPGATRGAPGPGVVGPLPVRVIRLDLAVVERSDRHLRPDTAVLPEEAR